MNARLVTLLALSTLAPSVAWAAPPAPAQAHAPTPEALAQARTHFERGVKLYEEDDCRAALIEFTRAYELSPHWQVLYNVGQAHYQLRDYANALRTFERYLAEGGDRVPAERRAQIAREIDELRGRVAHVAFVANVDGAEVTVDEAPLGTTPFAAPVLLGAGRHRVVVAKRGFVASSRVVDLAGGDDARLTFELTDAAPAKGPVDVAPTAAPRAPSAAPAIASFVVSGVGLAVGTVFGVVAMGDKAALDADCVNKVCPAGRQAGIDAYARDGLVATVGFGVGAAATVVGVVLLLRDGRGAVGVAAPPLHRTQARPTLTPWVGAGIGGVSGTF